MADGRLLRGRVGERNAYGLQLGQRPARLHHGIPDRAERQDRGEGRFGCDTGGKRLPHHHLRKVVHGRDRRLLYERRGIPCRSGRRTPHRRQGHRQLGLQGHGRCCRGAQQGTHPQLHHQRLRGAEGRCALHAQGRYGNRYADARQHGAGGRCHLCTHLRRRECLPCLYHQQHHRRQQCHHGRRHLPRREDRDGGQLRHLGQHRHH